MTAHNAKFEMAKGESRILEFPVLDAASAPLDITGANLQFSLKATRAGEPTGNAVISKTVGSGITITDGAGGLCEVLLASADTQTLEGLFYYKLVLVIGGNASFLADGHIKFTPN